MNNTEEIWRDVRDYEDKYEISNLGYIRSKRKVVGRGYLADMKPINPFRMNNGYLAVNLNDGHGRNKTVLVHRIVAEAFCEKPEVSDGKRLFVNHLNGCKEDNRACNLRYSTHMYKVCLYAKQVLQYTKDGRFVKCWDSVKEILEAHPGWFQHNLMRVLQKGGSTYRYIWKWADEIGDKEYAND